MAPAIAPTVSASFGPHLRRHPGKGRSLPGRKLWFDRRRWGSARAAEGHTGDSNGEGEGEVDDAIREPALVVTNPRRLTSCLNLWTPNPTP